MKIISIITKSKDQIKYFYKQHHDLNKMTYDEHHKNWVEDTFGGSEIWSTGLLRYGYQTKRIFENDIKLQRKWGKEAGIVQESTNWREEVLKAQISKYKPDILVISNYSALSADFIKIIKRDISSIRLIIGWCGAPYKPSAVFKEFDFILSNVPELFCRFINEGHRSYLLNHAFDPRVLDRIDLTVPPIIDFSFVGSIIKSNGYHRERELLLLDLLNSTNLEIWSSVNEQNIVQNGRIAVADLSYMIAQTLFIFGMPKEAITKFPWLSKFINLEQKPSSSYVDNQLLKRAHQPVYGIKMFEMLHKSRLTLNIHIDVSRTHASNMRMFEATGVGTCLLTDWKEKLSLLFEPDTEVVTYKTKEECIERANYLLLNEAQRKNIARAGQQRTMREHTIFHRAEQLDEIIRNYLKSKPVTL